MKLIDFIKEYNLDSSEIVFFGGSFHPWHEGHSECIRLLPKNKNLVVLPDHNPHKKLVESNARLSGIDEIKEELKKIPRETYLFDGFWSLDKVNPTVEWVKDLKGQNTGLKISLLMGFDSFEKIITWNESHILLNSLCTLYVVSRLEAKEQKELVAKKIKEVSPNIKIEFLGNHPFEHLSSTALRK